MNREELISKVKTLTETAKVMMAEKAVSLEKEQAGKTELYQWCREQLMAIHQMKYQFSQDVSHIHQECTRLNQETRNEIERMRRENSL